MDLSGWLGWIERALIWFAPRLDCLSRWFESIAQGRVSEVDSLAPAYEALAWGAKQIDTAARPALRRRPFAPSSAACAPFGASCRSPTEWQGRCRTWRRARSGSFRESGEKGL